MKADYSMRVKTSQDARRVVQALKETFDRRVVRADQVIEVKIGRWVPEKTVPQLRTVHLWFREIADQTGDTPLAVKEALKEMFLPVTIEVVLGRPVRFWPSLADLDKEDMSDFMERVQQLAAEMGFALTQPEPMWMRGVESAALDQLAAPA